MKILLSQCLQNLNANADIYDNYITKWKYNLFKSYKNVTTTSTEDNGSQTFV